MTNKLTSAELRKDILQLLGCSAFELCPDTRAGQTDNYLIPYMMNDAVESFILLKNCRLTGHFITGSDSDQLETCAELAEDTPRSALIIHQGPDNVVTVWFEEAWKETNFYQYHAIGHFWAEGQEQWRQLVYMIGTVYDKHRYLGSDAINPTEDQLLSLMEFAPFRMWSPIRDSLDDQYPETRTGAEVMAGFAFASRKRGFRLLCQIYRIFPFRPLALLLGHMLTSCSFEPLYRLLESLVVGASVTYPPRDYGPEINQKIQSERDSVTKLLTDHGFSGTYPHFQRGDLQVTAAEEHPFTHLDWDDFKFRIQFMVSQCPSDAAYINSGFFRGPGRKGKIVKNLTALLSEIS